MQTDAFVSQLTLHITFRHAPVPYPLHPIPGPLYPVSYEPTKPIEAERLKLHAVSNLSQNREKQSHDDELSFKSVDYGDFRPVFRKVAINRMMLYIADLGGHGWEANKAKQSQGT